MCGGFIGTSGQSLCGGAVRTFLQSKPLEFSLLDSLHFKPTPPEINSLELDYFFVESIIVTIPLCLFLLPFGQFYGIIKQSSLFVDFFPNLPVCF
jgi:hypothetical protein